MTKFIRFCATLLAFLVTAVAAVPQEHLAPAVFPENASKVLAARSVATTSINYLADKTGIPVARVQARQVHNADYGSNNGPSGNPGPSQNSGGADGSSDAPADDYDSGVASGDSSKEKMRRALPPQPSACEIVSYSRS